MVIDLTEEEKQTLKRRKALRAAQAEFHSRLEMDYLARSSKTKLRKGKAQKRAKFRADRLTFSGRTPQEHRVDRYIKQERDGFYSNDLWKIARYQTFKRAGHKCECCGETNGQMHVDHIKPRSKYPELALVLSNLQVLCQACNIGKGAWDETDWRNVTLGNEKNPA